MTNKIFAFLILCLLLVSFGNTELNKLDGYRGAKWGMSSDEVSKIDEIRRQRNSRGSNNTTQGHFVSHGYVFDLPGIDLVPAALVYHRDRLIRVSLKEDGVPEETVNRVIQDLTDKYGAPKYDDVTASDSVDGFALRDIRWVGRKTMICVGVMTLGGVKYDLLVDYVSREHMDVVRSCCNKTAVSSEAGE